jgi:hypothetical protein
MHVSVTRLHSRRFLWVGGGGSYDKPMPYACAATKSANDARILLWDYNLASKPRNILSKKHIQGVLNHTCEKLYQLHGCLSPGMLPAPCHTVAPVRKIVNWRQHSSLVFRCPYPLILSIDMAVSGIIWHQTHCIDCQTALR